MVVKIQKSNPGMKGTLQYNQKKVAKDTASILRVWNMDEGSVSFRDFARTFERYEKANIRTKGLLSFQMSINPNPAKPEEALTDDEARDYAKTIMDALGYGEQPIILYEHHDIGRKHYHVVSIRTNEEGRKIRDSFEKERLQRIMARNARKFHYVIGNDTPEETEKKKKTRTDAMGESVPRFDPKGSNIRGQLTDLFDEAMRYHFTTWSQFSSIMESFGVSTAWYGQESDTHLYFIGQDEDGNEASPFITEDEMGEDFGTTMQRRMQESAARKELTKEEKARRFGDRKRLAASIAGALGYSRNEEHLVKMLQRKGIHLVLSRTDEGQGEVFGATVVDRASMRAWKLSEIDRELLPPHPGGRPKGHRTLGEGSTGTQGGMDRPQEGGTYTGQHGPGREPVRAPGNRPSPGRTAPAAFTGNASCGLAGSCHQDASRDYNTIPLKKESGASNQY